MITVFYGSQIYGEYGSWLLMRNEITVADPVYQEGYIFGKPTSTQGNPKAQWWRVDGTPCLIEDVPKKLQMLALILGL